MTGAVAYLGLSHLGLVSAAAAAAKGFDVVAFDPDAALVEELKSGALPVDEPGLAEAVAKNAERLTFTAEAKDIASCGVVVVAADVATDDAGTSDLSAVEALLRTAQANARTGAAVVVLSQVPPGFTRARADKGGATYYQVETLVFGDAVRRALEPERIIVGAADPAAELPAAYRAFLDAFACPVLVMGYESAELAKIAINCCLAGQIAVTNTLAELCEAVGADWADIRPALRLDKRIGPYAYLAPGLGIGGGNIERDLATVIRLAGESGTDSGVVEAWVANSRRRKLAAAEVLMKTVLDDAGPAPVVAVWGLAYKANTDSVRNSPALATMTAMPGVTYRVHDPVVPASVAEGAEGFAEPLAALDGADALMILTPWPAYGGIAPAEIAAAMKGRVVIDPYGVLDGEVAAAAGLDHHSLGRPPRRAGKA